MPYFLRETTADAAAGSDVFISSDIVLDDGSDFEIGFDIQVNGTQWILASSVTSSNNLLFFKNDNELEVRRSGTPSCIFTLPNNYTGRYSYVLKTTASGLELTQNGAVCSFTGDNANTLFTLRRFFSISGASRYGDFYNLYININSVPTHNYDPSATNGTGSVLQDTIGGNDGTLNNFPTDDSQWVLTGGTLTPDQTNVKPADAITWTTSLTGLTGAYLEDFNGNRYALTSVTDTGGTIPALAANLQACVFGAVTLNVTDGVDTASAAITLDPPTGYTLTTLTSVPVAPVATDWVFDFDNPAVIGTQSLNNSPIYTHNSDATTSGVVAGTYPYFVIDPSDGVVSEITKTFEAQGAGNWTIDASDWFKQSNSPFYDGNSPTTPRQGGNEAIAMNLSLSTAGRLGFFIDYSERTTAGTHTFYVARTHGSTGAVSVDYSTGGDSHTSVTGTLSWGNGELDIKSFTVEVSSADLASHESSGLGEHRIWALLSNPTGGAALHFEAEHTRAYGVIDTGSIASDANAVFYDADAVSNGTGTQTSPYNSLTDAVANVGTKRYLYGKGTTTVTAQIAAPATRTGESDRLYVRNWPSNTWLIQGSGTTPRGFYADSGESYCSYKGIDFANIDSSTFSTAAAIFYHYGDSIGINIEQCTAINLNGKAGSNSGAFMLWGVNGGKVWRCTGDNIANGGNNAEQNTGLVYSYDGLNLSVQRCEASNTSKLVFHKRVPAGVTFRPTASVRFCKANNCKVLFGRSGSSGVPHSYTIAQCNVFTGDGGGVSHQPGTIGQNGNNNGEKHWFCNNVMYQAGSYGGSLGMQQAYSAAVFNNIFYDCKRMWSESLDSSAYGPDIEFADYNMDFSTERPAERYRWKGTYYTLPADLNAANPAFAGNDFEADPLFTDPVNGDFTLQAGSPALTGGVDGSQMGLYLGDFYTIGAA